MNDRYWDSLAGIRHQHRWRSARHVLASVGHEPERKGRRGVRSAGAFRQAVKTGGIGSDRRVWPRATLALTLGFTTSRRQPPNVEQLAKHYLDLLGSQTGDQGGPVLYSDDRQVKMLYVSCRHNWDPEKPVARGSIHLDCCSRADAIGVLEVAHELEVFHEGPSSDADEWRRDELDAASQLEEARRLEQSEDELMRRMAADMRFDALRAYQEHFLRSSDRWLTSLLRSRGRELITGELATRERRLARRLQSAGVPHLQTAWTPTNLDDELQGYFQVPLPPLPRQRGERRDFKQNLHEACRRFLSAHPSLSPLVVPLRITILVVSPHDKDLDNLALEVVPVINEHFKPHQAPWLLDATYVGMPAGLRRYDVERRRRQLAQLKSVGELSVWAYQVIELHRRPEHPPEGWVSVVLGHGENRRSVWGEAEDYVDAVLARDERSI
jgi:hypothetical protein